MLNAIGVGDNVIEKYPQTQIMYPGGNVVSFAYFASQLGCRSAYLGTFADDLAGMHIKTTLMSLNIDVSHCKGHHGKTRETEVNIINGDRIFREIPSERNDSNKVNLSNYDYQYISNFHLLLTDCMSHIENDLPNIKALGVPILFDFSDSWTVEYLERVCPYVYLSFLSCANYSDDEIRDVLKKAVEFGSKIAIATMGDRGAILYNGIRFYKRNAVRVKVIDTLGAGSAFVTCFIVKYIEALYEEEKIGTVSRDMIEDLTEYALSEASFFAAKVTTKDGPFGYGVEYTDEIEEEAVACAKNGKKIVLGVIGADVHAVGNKILNYAFDKAGFMVYNLGVMVSQEEFVQAAIETEADAILVSSLYGHGELDCRGLREKCIESGIPDVVLYVGGNLVVGKASFPDVEKKFKDMGFNRVFSNTDPLDLSISLLKQDLGVQ